MDWGERAFQGQAPKELKKMTFSVDRKWGFLGGGGCWQIGLGNRVFEGVGLVLGDRFGGGGGGVGNSNGLGKTFLGGGGPCRDNGWRGGGDGIPHSVGNV